MRAYTEYAYARMGIHVYAFSADANYTYILVHLFLSCTVAVCEQKMKEVNSSLAFLDDQLVSSEQLFSLITRRTNPRNYMLLQNTLFTLANIPLTISLMTFCVPIAPEPPFGKRAHLKVALSSSVTFRMTRVACFSMETLPL